MFEKHNPIKGSRALECELHGLEELRKHKKLHGLDLPEVIELKPDKLLLKSIESVPPTAKDWQNLGAGLARLHQVQGESFGFYEDNFIGLNEQKNKPCNDWAEFFIKHRLYFQINLILSPSVKNEFLQIMTAIEGKLYTFLNQHNPRASLLHGDLWSGNVMFAKSGPYLIDPAVYYGDRECDIAMTRLFGGFDSAFYKAYNELYPLKENYEIREKIYNLYHYLNHYNIFGKSYLSACQRLTKELALSFL